MRVTYDPEVDAAYIYLKREPVLKTEVVTDAVNIDLDADGNLIGIEILWASTQFPVSSLSSLEFEQFPPRSRSLTEASDGS